MSCNLKTQQHHGLKLSSNDSLEKKWDVRIVHVNGMASVWAKNIDFFCKLVGSEMNIDLKKNLVE